MPRGQTLLEAGAEPRYFYIVREGQARIELADQRRPNLLVGAGGFFGEDGVLTQQPRNAKVVMSEAGVLLRGEKVHLDYLVDALWWYMRHKKNITNSKTRPLTLPNWRSSLALRSWLDGPARPICNDSATADLLVQSTAGYPSSRHALQDLALLLLVHRGARPVLAESVFVDQA